MHSRLKLLQSFCHMGYQIRLSRCTRDDRCAFRKSYFLSNAFGTVVGSLQVSDNPHVTESPENQDGLKSLSLRSTGFEKFNYSDDFWSPSLAKWIEDYKVHFPEVDLGSKVGNIPDYEVDQISEILNYQFESPHAVVKELSDCTVEVTDNLVEQILKRFSFDWIPCFGFFKWATSQRGFKFSPELYTLMLDNMGKSRKFDLMFEILEEMKQLDVSITRLTLRKVMRRLSKAGKLDDAINVCRNLEQFGFPNDAEAMNMLLEAVANNRGITHAEKVYLELKGFLSPDAITFNILVHGWCQAKKIEKAKEIVSEMKRHGFDPDTVTCNCFIEAHCHKKDFHEVDAMLKYMEMNGIVPSVVTHTIIVAALGRAKQMNRALEIYEMMKERGYDLDSFFYKALIEALSRSGRWKDACKVFVDMAKQGVARDTLTYSAMIAAAVWNSRVVVALLTLKEMEEHQCKPDLETYVPLLTMCCKLRRMKVLDFLLRHMFRNNVTLNIGIYSLLVKELCASGNLDRACSLFEESVKKGMVPMDAIYKDLLKGLVRKKMNKERAWIQELMQQAQLQGSLHSSRSSFRVQE